MLNNNFKNTIYILTLILVDLLALFLVFILTNSLYGLSGNTFDKYSWILFLTIVIFLFDKIYFVRYDFWHETRKLFKGLIISMITVFIVVNLTQIQMHIDSKIVFYFYLYSFVFLPFNKRVFKKILFSILYFKINVKIVATKEQEIVISKEFLDNWYLGFQINEQKYDLVLISSKGIELENLEKVIRKYSKKTASVYVIPYLNKIDFSHSNIIDYFNIRYSAIQIENRLLNKKNIFIKYFFEKLLVILLFPFVIVLHLLLSLVIKYTSNGKVLFKQKRVGKDGKIFSIYKYRTMYENGDKILVKYLLENPEEKEYYSKFHKYKNDPRITKVGSVLRKTSLDEIPQFYNVLRGDMNLIGPRPFMNSEIKKIGKYSKNIIFNVKPGITGLWQVSGRSDLSFNDRVLLDKWYIQNWSLWMDFVIFMKTIKVVLFKVGAK